MARCAQVPHWCCTLVNLRKKEIFKSLLFFIKESKNFLSAMRTKYCACADLAACPPNCAHLLGWIAPSPRTAPCGKIAPQFLLPKSKICNFCVLHSLFHCLQRAHRKEFKQNTARTKIKPARECIKTYSTAQVLFFTQLYEV